MFSKFKGERSSDDGTQACRAAFASVPPRPFCGLQSEFGPRSQYFQS